MSPEVNEGKFPFHPISMQLPELFPGGVETSAGEPLFDRDKLFEEEWELVRNAVENRQAEFCGGRICAREVLKALGISDCAVGSNPDRSPRWPQGIVGSISHAGNVCAAVAGFGEQFIGLGLDIEPDEPLDEDIIPMVCHGDELELLQQSEEPERLAKWIFCIKEAAFKCQYPITRNMLEFEDAVVRVDIAGGSFAVCLPGLSFPGTGNLIEVNGRFRINDRYVLAGAFIPNESRW